MSPQAASRDRTLNETISSVTGHWVLGMFALGLGRFAVCLLLVWTSSLVVGGSMLMHVDPYPCCAGGLMLYSAYRFHHLFEDTSVMLEGQSVAND